MEEMERLRITGHDRPEYPLENEEMSVGALGEYVDLSQSALSQHLAKMREEGLVACRKEAQTVHYRIADPRVKTLILSLKEIFCP